MPPTPCVSDNARPSYNSCGLCGRTPSSSEETNWAPKRWWDCDDGWKITTLCRWCFDEVHEDRPSPSDYATKMGLAKDACSGEPETDEDPTLVVFPTPS